MKLSRFCKKVAVSLLVILGSSVISAAELGFRLAGQMDLCSEKKFGSVFGGVAALDFSPVTIRKQDDLIISVEGSLLNFRPDGIDSFNIFDVSFGLGYEFRPLDRLSFELLGNVGLYKVPEIKGVDADSLSGISFGGKFFVNFYIIPELSLNAFAGVKQFYYKPDPFATDFQIGLGLKYNFTKGLFSKSSIEKIENDEESAPVFPVFYSRYSTEPFGKLSFVNREKNRISDIEVSLFVENLMSNPEVCAKVKKADIGEQFDIGLTAFFNEAVLNNLTSRYVDAVVSVRYKSLGKPVVYTDKVTLQVLNRNNMTWEDDRRAAAFVSPADGTASTFAKQVKAVAMKNLSGSTPENIQYAKALFNALKAFGLNYVVDPASSFVDNTGTSQIDFLQFPYQTLLYRGGDCDDLSILNCALFESIGIEAAFITVPGHIYIAFDSGVSPENASKAGDCVVQDGKVWIPLEITLCQNSFEEERKTGMMEWKKYPKDRVLIPLSEAWKEYPAVGIPDSDVKIELPSKSAIIK